MPPDSNTISLFQFPRCNYRLHALHCRAMQFHATASCQAPKYPVFKPPSWEEGDPLSDSALRSKISFGIYTAALPPMPCSMTSTGPPLPPASKRISTPPPDSGAFLPGDPVERVSATNYSTSGSTGIQTGARFRVHVQAYTIPAGSPPWGTPANSFRPGRLARNTPGRAQAPVWRALPASPIFPAHASRSAVGRPPATNLHHRGWPMNDFTGCSAIVDLANRASRE